MAWQISRVSHHSMPCGKKCELVRLSSLVAAHGKIFRKILNIPNKPHLGQLPFLWLIAATQTAAGVPRQNNPALGNLPIFETMDYKKTVLYVSGLFLATGGPITLFSGADMLSANKDAANPPPATATDTHQTLPNNTSVSSTGSASQHTVAQAAPYSTPYASPAMPSPTLEEALRFDVTVEWIISRWPRVTTGLSHLQMQGYRVTLMTGPMLPDVAGSLTYYFNPQQQVQRITLAGTTGDPSRLVSIVSSRHNFARRLVNDPGLILYEARDPNNRLVGELKIRSAQVILASQPYTRYNIDLTMERADWEK